MKPRIILHLGLWKTGTTTIQYFLRGNPELLARAGVFYPKVAPDNPDHPFFRRPPATRYLTDEVSHRYLARELAEGKRQPGVVPPLWSTAFRRFGESGAHTAIVSYEDLSARAEAYDFSAIAERLKAFEVTGIVYLRPQEAWAVSLYSHFVRGGRTTLLFAEFVDSIRPRLTYSALLDRIRANIPLDRLVTRDFDQAVKTGLLADFFSSLDLAGDFATIAPQRETRNKSQPAWVLLFGLACARAELPAERLGEIRKALNRFGGSADAPSLRPGLDMASPDERAALRAIMAEDRERLAERHGFGFAEPPARPMPYRPFDDEDFNAIRAALTPQLPQPARPALAGL